MKLLITDDEYATRSSIKHLLEKDAHGIDQILEAENFEEAITQIIQYNPEIIITDIVMPVHDGIYLMDWICQHAPQSRVIAVSGHDNFYFVKSTIQKGGIDYLLKPLDSQELNQAVHHAVSEYQKEQEFNLLKAQSLLQQTDDIPVSIHPVMMEVKNYIRQHYTEQLRQQDIADYFYINKEYLSRKFKKEFHLSMVEYINQLRIEKAKQLLCIPGMKIVEVSSKIGFTDEKYFSTVFKKITGISPKTYYLTHAGSHTTQ